MQEMAIKTVVLIVYLCMHLTIYKYPEVRKKREIEKANMECQMKITFH